jgi:MerR family transcriptional regulator, mercuric resistance operon regulatory protein
MTATLRAGEVAAAAGVNIETLRYYERRGLITEPARSSGGHRLYSPDVVTLLRVIKAAQRLGFTLDETAGLLAAGVHRHRDRRRSTQDRIQAKVVEVDQRIADLQLIRESLIAALAAGCEDLVTCAGTPECPIPFSGLAPAVPS